jgi:membrane protease YdiL (CAAX protease family)
VVTLAPRPLPGTTLAGAVAAGGMCALLLRPWLLPADDPSWGGRALLFATIGILAWLWPLGAGIDDPVAHPGVALTVFLLGSLAFGLGRLVAGAPGRPAELGTVLALNALAAVAEEAFFRRMLYGIVLARWGTGAAVVGSAAAFALVHVPVWGLEVLALDLAAGLLLSWQRAATGRWTVPAATHVVANTFAFL